MSHRDSSTSATSRTPGDRSSPEDRNTSVEQLKELVSEFVNERNWKKFHNAKNLSMALTVEAGELMEHFQWLRSEEVEAGHGYDAEQVAEELADIVAYALAIANSLQLDVATIMHAKMKKNRKKYPVDQPFNPSRPRQQ